MKTIKETYLKRHLITMLVTGPLIIAAETASAAAIWREEEARKMEQCLVQAAVTVMMARNEISVLPNPIAVSTSYMRLFPYATT